MVGEIRPYSWALFVIFSQLEPYFKKNVENRFKVCYNGRILNRKRTILRKQVGV